MKQPQWKNWQLYWHNFEPQSYIFLFIYYFERKPRISGVVLLFIKKGLSTEESPLSFWY